MKALISEQYLQDIADAIREKNGETNCYTPSEMAEKILAIPTGGSSASSSDVNFYDYDGTIVESYTKDEFLALSALPENPSHEGLTAQGWNYSLADAQAYVTKYGKLNVGQMYITSSGATEIDIELTEGRTTPTLGIRPDGTVTIEWGDGTTDTASGTSLTTLVNTQHAYASAGKYTIKLTTSDSFAIIADSSSASQLLWDQKTSSNSTNRTYQNAIKSVRIGEGVTSIGLYAFGGCYSLSSVTIPEGVTSIGQYTFGGCYSLSSVTIPEGVTTIGGNAFSSCSSLSSVTIPDSVTSISGNAFSNCSSVAEYHLKPTTPPTIQGSTFSNIPSDCIIYVPTGSLAAYQSASNWSTYASLMREE